MTAPDAKPSPMPRPPEAVFKAAEALARMIVAREVRARTETQRG